MIELVSLAIAVVGLGFAVHLILYYVGKQNDSVEAYKQQSDEYARRAAKLQVKVGKLEAAVGSLNTKVAELQALVKQEKPATPGIIETVDGRRLTPVVSPFDLAGTYNE